MSILGSFGAVLTQLVDGVSELKPLRWDSWVNLATGFGTSRDKSMASSFQPGQLLTDQDFRALYTFDDLAGKIADAYPKEEMRLGFGIGGYAPEEISAAEKYLRKFELPQSITDARIWGNVFGGSAIWPLVADGLAPEEPLDLDKIQTVLGLRVIDRRWLIPEVWYYTGPKAGYPELYRIVQPTQGGALLTIGRIHETRLVKFPGARTEWQQKLTHMMWDDSVYLKVYDALRSSGNTWKAIETLVCDANQGVFKIQNLFDLVTADPAQQDDAANFAQSPSGKLLKRISFMDRTRSVGRAIVLDKDLEDFERKPTSFAGLAELSDRAWKRVSAASDTPMCILVGDAPAGLNATGDPQLEGFYSKVSQNQVQLDEPRIRQLLRILFAAKDAPKLTQLLDAGPTTKAKTGRGLRAKADAILSGAQISAQVAQYGMASANNPLDISQPQSALGTDPIEDLTITWLPLWAPSAVEQAAINLQQAQAGQIWITAQVLLPEEVALSLGPNSGWKFDREAREDILEENAEDLLAKRAETALNPPELDPENNPPAKGPKTTKETT